MLRRTRLHHYTGSDASSRIDTVLETNVMSNRRLCQLSGAMPAGEVREIPFDKSDEARVKGTID